MKPRFGPWNRSGPRSADTPETQRVASGVGAWRTIVVNGSLSEVRPRRQAADCRQDRRRSGIFIRVGDAGFVLLRELVPKTLDTTLSGGPPHFSYTAVMRGQAARRRRSSRTLRRRIGRCPPFLGSNQRLRHGSHCHILMPRETAVSPSDDRASRARASGSLRPDPAATASRCGKGQRRLSNPRRTA